MYEQIFIIETRITFTAGPPQPTRWSKCIRSQRITKAPFWRYTSVSTEVRMETISFKFWQSDFMSTLTVYTRSLLVGHFKLIDGTPYDVMEYWMGTNILLFQDIIRRISQERDYSHLLGCDQLGHEQERKGAFFGFSEFIGVVTIIC